MPVVLSNTRAMMLRRGGVRTAFDRAQKTELGQRRSELVGIKHRITNAVLALVLVISSLLISTSLAGANALVDNDIASPALSRTPEQGQMPTIPPQPPSPPRNFSPLTATDVDLQLYDFPTRPSDPVNLAQQQDVMSHAKYHGRPIQTPSNRYNGLGKDCLE